MLSFDKFGRVAKIGESSSSSSSSLFETKLKRLHYVQLTLQEKIQSLSSKLAILQEDTVQLQSEIKENESVKKLHLVLLKLQEQVQSLSSKLTALQGDTIYTYHEVK